MIRKIHLTGTSTVSTRVPLREEKRLPCTVCLTTLYIENKGTSTSPACGDEHQGLLLRKHRMSPASFEEACARARVQARK